MEWHAGSGVLPLLLLLRAAGPCERPLLLPASAKRMRIENVAESGGATLAQAVAASEMIHMEALA